MDPPPFGWWKINLDGSCSSSNNIAAGGLIRDSNGNWVMGFSKFLGGGTILYAELWAIVYGLDLAYSAGGSKIVVESDSLSAIALIIDLNTPVSHHLFPIISRCRRFGHLVAETPLSIGARDCLGTGTKPRVFSPPGGRNTRAVKVPNLTVGLDMVQQTWATRLYQLMQMMVGKHEDVLGSQPRKVALKVPSSLTPAWSAGRIGACLGRTGACSRCPSLQSSPCWTLTGGRSWGTQDPLTAIYIRTRRKRLGGRTVCS
ncbi:putative ribonuclease H-like domain-containing protein [Senna tora]|uniref:Putative ribonuclease H-like domain-containing protein n=1 Tax=Senna tora TaxID=362788 RepID=A0A834WC86_9FABA|nr:putative ribonuclease H-like domain-containing protein [Senna tora]